MGGKSSDPLRRALWLEALDQQLRPHLPPSLERHCRLANVNDGQLVFLVDSPVWHARVRLASAQLLDAARSIGLKATRVTVKTASGPLDPAASVALRTHSHRQKPVSEATHKGLRDALAALQDLLD